MFGAPSTEFKMKKYQEEQQQPFYFRYEGEKNREKCPKTILEITATSKKGKSDLVNITISELLTKRD